jgi:hypothetical protein
VICSPVQRSLPRSRMPRLRTRRFRAEWSENASQGTHCGDRDRAPERMVRVFFTREHAQAWRLRTPHIDREDGTLANVRC